VYRLEADSRYEYGCQPPCDCPLLEAGTVRGTLKLGAPQPGDVFDFYPVEHVNWVVTLSGGAELRITGSGRYKRTNFDETPEHMIELDLRVGDRPVEHFFSELVPAEGVLESLSFTISVNGVFCFDTVVSFDARPLRPHEVQVYRLVRWSYFQEGCWDPCACPIREPVPTVGSFGLVPLPAPDETSASLPLWAVVDLSWLILDGTPVEGFGLYRASPDFMSLELAIGAEQSSHFETVLSSVDPAPPPQIRTQIAMNGLVCFDRTFGFAAVPDPCGLEPVGSGDFDLDGVCNDTDNCPNRSNPTQADTSDSGVGDDCQCGDVTGDGLSNVVDALTIARGEVLSADSRWGHCDVDAEIARGEVGSSPEQQSCPAYRELCLSPVCGDRVCEGDENGCNCSVDCGPGGCALCGPRAIECGDGRCDPFCAPDERHEACPRDCLCPPRAARS
jgi:hypothetical protein